VKRRTKTLNIIKEQRKKQRQKAQAEKSSGEQEVAPTLGKRIRLARKPGSRLTPAHPRIFKCHLESCAKIFNDRASLKKHMTVHGDKLNVL